MTNRKNIPPEAWKELSALGEEEDFDLQAGGLGMSLEEIRSTYRWTGAPGLPERDVLARSTAEYAEIIVELDDELDKLRNKVSLALEAADSVIGTYKHPDQLKQATLNAFDRMVVILKMSQV